MKRLLIIFMILIFLLFTAEKSTARTEVTFYVSFGIVIGGVTLFLSFGGEDYSNLLRDGGSVISQNIESSAPCYPVLRW